MSQRPPQSPPRVRLLCGSGPQNSGTPVHSLNYWFLPKDGEGCGPASGGRDHRARSVAKSFRPPAVWGQRAGAGRRSGSPAWALADPRPLQFQEGSLHRCAWPLLIHPTSPGGSPGDQGAEPRVPSVQGWFPWQPVLLLQAFAKVSPRAPTRLWREGVCEQQDTHLVPVGKTQTCMYHEFCRHKTRQESGRAPSKVASPRGARPREKPLSRVRNEGCEATCHLPQQPDLSRVTHGSEQTGAATRLRFG